MISSMDPRMKEKVRKTSSEHWFKFGAGGRMKSLACVEIPISLNGRNMFLKTEVVDTDIPCLLSKKAMKLGKTKIDTERDVINIFGVDNKLVTAKSGHYKMEVGDWDMSKTNMESMVLIQSLENMDDEEKLKKLRVMHNNLGHPGKKVMKAMIKDPVFNNIDSEIVNKLYESCEPCFELQQTKSKFKVSLPMAHDFNQTLCMDLKIWSGSGKIILYVIDMFTRYVQAKVIPNKKPESVLKVLIEEWIKRWGSPSAILVDNGGEFVNDKMNKVCETFGIKLLTTGSYSPNQNGLCEKNHQIVDKIIEKLISDDQKLPFEEALSSAVFAKNMLVNVYGYSPLQLVTGKQPKLPGATSDQLTAQEGEHEETKGITRIASIANARKAFTEVENSERLKKAMKNIKAKRTFFNLENLYTSNSEWTKGGEDRLES